MCEENRNALNGIEEKAEAIALYKKTIDWALEQGYPSIETIREHFSDCEDYGIYVDSTFHNVTLNDQQVYVFHHCTGTIYVGLNEHKGIIPMLYFANDCDMTVLAIGEDAGVTPLYIFGKNAIRTDATQGSCFRVFNMGVKNG